MVDFAAAEGASADLEAFLILMAVMVIKQEGAARLKESVGFDATRNSNNRQLWHDEDDLLMI